MRGRGGGTFVAEPRRPPTDPPARALLAGWREVCDARLAVELGVAVLAAGARDRARPRRRSTSSSAAMDDRLEDFAAYRQADVRFHVGLAEATGSAAPGRRR